MKTSFKQLVKQTGWLSVTSCLCSLSLHAQEKKNVLFIFVDDLRTELGCYGSPVQTPNIDRLASQSVVFRNAYCNVPVSGASRASLLTGVYPDFERKRFVDAETYSQNDLPGVTTLPQAFKEQGYHTVSLGKVFHHHDDRTDSWSETPWIVSPASGDWATYNKWNVWKKTVEEKDLHPRSHRGPYYESADLPDSCYEDNTIARKAIQKLGELKERKEPFFLAVGFRKPHLPFIAPQKYWDLYEEDSIAIAGNRYRPSGLPKQVQSSREICQYTQTDDTSSEAFHRKTRHAYYACVSFVDIYPTLCKACHIPLPSHLQGKSFLPTLVQPQKKHRPYAYIQWVKGENLLDGRYSYAEWHNDARQLTGKLLFDHQADPDENRNAATSEQYEKQTAAFGTQMKKAKEQKQMKSI
ncbi:sulfatase [Bacteroides gallinaceum]|uniref:Sulfatase n=1 Tax=Bacteroides gallinaceum TaxID=1462571 RepID=A0ABT7VJL0_9BACE|nr:sulfatase [Bacteroides gallinaceum]MDM8326457.1 sulfatase [Bacteroides gallinaceum]